jgi:multiple sugar transport system substrate-binding protein
MNHFILYRWFSRFCPSRQSGVALLLGAVVGLPLLSVSAQEAFKEPDYSKFTAESGPITLEVWSWVGGLDKAAKLFEQAYPNIKVHVNNVGGGPAEYQKLQTAIKAGSGGPDVAQIEYMFLPSFIVTDGLADLSKYGANDLKSYSIVCCLPCGSSQR